MASVLWVKGEREEAAACAEDAAARFDQLGHPARAVKIRQDLKKRALFFPSEIEYYAGSVGPSAKRDHLTG